MNGSQTLLDAWNTRAETWRQAMAQKLAQKPAAPTVAAVRSKYLERAQTVLDNRKNWAQAYASHLHALAQIVSTGVSGAGSSSSKGSLGD
jgi:hypothetical protein